MALEAFAVEPYSLRGWAWLVPCGAVGYFADSGTDRSLASWLAANIDPAARGADGLAVFSVPPATMATAAWRYGLLRTARRWYAAAGRLRGRASVIGRPGHTLQVVDEAGTLGYIEWVRDLLCFAELVWATGSPVEVRLTRSRRP